MISIVIPLYNESKNISELISEIQDNLKKYYDYEIILINDASTDDTLHTISMIKDKKIKILNNIKNQGQSFSIRYGVKESIHQIIITLDGDGQNDPGDILKLLEYYLEHNNVKLVGGIRKKRQDNLIKIISSKIANYIRSRIFNDGCMDTGCSLKVFDKNIFLSFPFFDGIHRFLPALFRGFGYETKFISVNHRSRKFGISNYGTANRLIRGIRDIIKVKKILIKKY
jgi:dolichol-phosphate mannosyltransferase